MKIYYFEIDKRIMENRKELEHKIDKAFERNPWYRHERRCGGGCTMLATVEDYFC